MCRGSAVTGQEAEIAQADHRTVTEEGQRVDVGLAGIRGFGQRDQAAVADGGRESIRFFLSGFGLGAQRNTAPELLSFVAGKGREEQPDEDY